MGPGDVIDTALAGICAGAGLMGTVIFARSRLPWTLRLAMTLTCGAGALYVLKLRFLGIVAQHSVIAAVVLVAVSVPVPAFLWIAVRALFDDRAVSRWAWTAPGTLAALGLATNLPLGPYWRGAYGEWAVVGISAALALHGLYVVCRSWRNDLVEGRRRLRGPLLGVFGLSFLVLISSLVQTWAAIFGLESQWIDHVSWIVLTGAVVLFATLFDVRRSPFAPTPDLPAPDQAREEDAQLRTLHALMSEREIWRKEALSIADLAAEMGLAQPRLRRLINVRLGHRNFTAYINFYRIEAAKDRLADPARRRETIAAVAYDLGFSSLNPFNRAFKEMTGQTPTEWRRRKSLVET
jgi:AraC-like DNA-binding protein